MDQRDRSCTVIRNTEKRKIVRQHRPTENLAYALRTRVPEMSPNRHQQPTAPPAATYEREAGAGLERVTHAREHGWFRFTTIVM